MNSDLSMAQGIIIISLCLIMIFGVINMMRVHVRTQKYIKRIREERETERELEKQSQEDMKEAMRHYD